MYLVLCQWNPSKEGTRAPVAVEKIGGLEGNAPNRRRHGGLGAEPPALGDFAIFFKNSLILGLF